MAKWSGFFRGAGKARADSEPAELEDIRSRQYREIVDQLREHVIHVSGGTLTGDDVLEDVDMYDAGYIDSIGVTEFMIRVTTQYDVPVPDWKIGTELKSLQDVARHIQEQLQAPGTGNKQ